MLYPLVSAVESLFSPDPYKYVYLDTYVYNIHMEVKAAIIHLRRFAYMVEVRRKRHAFALLKLNSILAKDRARDVLLLHMIETFDSLNMDMPYSIKRWIYDH